MSSSGDNFGIARSGKNLFTGKVNRIHILMANFMPDLLSSQFFYAALDCEPNFIIDTKILPSTKTF